MLAFRDAPHSSLAATVFRVVRKGVDPLSSRGSELNGGRYNLPGTKGVLYASFETLVAVAEVSKGLMARGINPTDYGPDEWWVYELELSSNRVLDLTDTKVMEALQITRASIIGDEFTITRRIGKEAIEAGFDAIIAPSAANPEGENIVIFLTATTRPPTVRASTPVSLSEKNAS